MNTPNSSENARICPTCGPTKAEQHPRRLGVARCSNCKEWLTVDCVTAGGCILDNGEACAATPCTALTFWGTYPDCPAHGFPITAPALSSPEVGA